MKEYIPFMLMAILWLGQLLWFLAKNQATAKIMKEQLERQDKDIKSLSDVCRKDTEEIRKEVKELKEWGEDQVKQRSEYNEAHYLSLERFNECNKEIMRRLDDISNLELQSRLTRMETQLNYIAVELEKLNSKK